MLGLTADAEGKLWIRLRSPNILRYSDGKFEDVSTTLPEGERAVTAMGRGKNGDVLFSALVNGTLRYGEDRFVTLAPAVALPNFLVISIAEAEDGRIWLGTRDSGLFSLSGGRMSNIGKGLPDRKVSIPIAKASFRQWGGALGTGLPPTVWLHLSNTFKLCR